MQRASTFLQHLTFRPNISFSNPATPNGKSWNSALKQITLSQGWSQLHWGTQIPSEEIVDLLITWTSHADLQHFMAHEYRPFATAVESLILLYSSSWNPIPTPYITQLHPRIPNLELGAVSSLYELSFSAAPDADVKEGFAIETQLCRDFFMDAARASGDGDLFLGMDAGWVERYDPLAPSSPCSVVTESVLEKGRQEHDRRQVFLIITEWTGPYAENTILNNGRIEESSRGGYVLTTGEYFTRNLLQKASAYTRREVVFENVSASNVQWLDEEEKWSTCVARLLAGEYERKNEGAAEPSG